ncbi:MAG TPA: hypothetical protein VK609_06815 [Mucilaginibacter sp.]|nr:hypothetical protein [Mucilaginibacter sp.]
MLITPCEIESSKFQLFTSDSVVSSASRGDGPIEGDWDDEDDEDFDDRLDAEFIPGRPGPEDDDHLPDDDLQ